MRTLASLLIYSLALPAATLPSAKPEEVGISTIRLRRVHDLMERYIRSGEVAGTVTLVARKGRVVHLEAQGLAEGVVQSGQLRHVPSPVASSSLCYPGRAAVTPRRRLRAPRGAAPATS